MFGFRRRGLGACAVFLENPKGDWCRSSLLLSRLRAPDNLSLSFAASAEIWSVGSLRPLVSGFGFRNGGLGLHERSFMRHLSGFGLGFHQKAPRTP